VAAAICKTTLKTYFEVLQSKVAGGTKLRKRVYPEYGRKVR